MRTASLSQGFGKSLPRLKLKRTWDSLTLAFVLLRLKLKRTWNSGKPVVYFDQLLAAVHTESWSQHVFNLLGDFTYFSVIFHPKTRKIFWKGTLKNSVFSALFSYSFFIAYQPNTRAPNTYQNYIFVFKFEQISYLFSLKNSRPCRDLNPGPPWYPADMLPIELSWLGSILNT